MKTILAILLFPSLVSAAVLDAAEYDIDSNPLTYQGSPMVAWRATIDNTQGATDLVNVRFTMNYTGTINGVFDLWWDNPANPWLGASNAQWEFLIDGDLWIAGVIYYPPTHEWGPTFRPEGGMPDTVRKDVVPAGCSWDAVMAISGPDVKLFASPASGDLTIDGVTTTLYDWDPLPQTIPEPFSAVVLLGVLFLKRRHASVSYAPLR